MDVDRGHGFGRSVQHPVRGALVAILLGPVFIAGALLVITALLSTLVSGWMPSTWFSGNAADWLVGTGARGDAANYVRVMVGGVVAATTGVAIRWGFVGHSGP